jgi:acetyl esterase/lipase
MNRTCLFSVALAAALAGAVALAGEPASKTKGPDLLQQLERDDRDGDGKVTRQEFTGPPALFRAVDRNRDGIIEKAEAEEYLRERTPAPPLPEGVEEVRDVVFGTGGGRPLKLNILRPKPQPADPMPVLVWVHGGAWRSGSKEGHMTLPFAQRGYFTASIEYRLSQEAKFPAQIEDCKAAIRWLRAHAKEYGLDPDRIGVWGSSAGGHLVALLGTSGGVAELEGQGGSPDQSSRVQAVCDFFGPSDLMAMIGARSIIDRRKPDCPEALLIGGPLAQKQEEARKASPITYVTPDDPPFLIVHGDRDVIVPFNQSELLEAALKKAGVDVTFVRVQRGGHGTFASTEPGPDEIQKAVEAFFDKHLKPATKP